MRVNSPGPVRGRGATGGGAGVATGAGGGGATGVAAGGGGAGSPIGAAGPPAWNMRVNSPSPVCGRGATGGGAAAATGAGGGGATGAATGGRGVASPIGAAGPPAWNMRVNSPGPVCGGAGTGAAGSGVWAAGAGGMTGTRHFPTRVRWSRLPGGRGSPYFSASVTINSRRLTTPGRHSVTTNGAPSFVPVSSSSGTFRSLSV